MSERRRVMIPRTEEVCPKRVRAMEEYRRAKQQRNPVVVVERRITGNCEDYVPPAAAPKVVSDGVRRCKFCDLELLNARNATKFCSEKCRIRSVAAARKVAK